MVPVGGATKQHPALFVIRGGHGDPPVAILSTSAPDPSGVPTVGAPAGQPSAGQAGSRPRRRRPRAYRRPPTRPRSRSRCPAARVRAARRRWPTNTTDGGVVYDVAYALVTVTGGANVTNTNSAYALAHCKACTTVAVSFQVVLIVGRSKVIAPINAAGALNDNCPACMTDGAGRPDRGDADSRRPRSSCSTR